MKNKEAKMNGECRARDLTFRYFEDSKRNILDKVNITFREGEVTVVMGNSGCGKSTLAAVLCGLYPENGGYLESGYIEVGDRDLADLPFNERSRYMAQMFQNPDLQFCMNNLKEEMCFCLENHRVPRQQMDDIIQDAAHKYRIEELLERPFTELSGGEKQKAALSCLFLVDPKIMVLDEPFANLDDKAAASYIELLKQKVSEDHTTVIAIDHRAENWLEIADNFMILGEHCSVIRECIKKEDLVNERELLCGQGLRDPFGKEPLKSKGKRQRVAEGKTAIEFKNVSIVHKNAGLPQLAGVNLSAQSGEMIACLGPSGGGKTTLFLSLLGQKKYSGSICLNGRELKKIKKKDIFSQIGIVFQNPANQFVTTSVQAEIEASLKIWTELDTEERAKKTNVLLESYGLRSYRKYSPFMLSQGQQRRLGVLSMLAGGQKILLLDEPTYGQDSRTTDAIMEQMSQAVREGLTIIFSTHDTSLAARFADRIWRVEGGMAYEEH